MTDRLEHLLARQPRLTPSPRFAARTMTAVRAEAADRAALPVPWRRAVLGAAAIAAVGGLAWHPDVALALRAAWHTGVAPWAATAVLALAVVRSSSADHHRARAP